MLIADTITNTACMSSRGIFQSISKVTSKPPDEVFTGLARQAARRTSQRIGAHVEFTDNALEVREEHFPTQVILKIFKESLVRLAKQAAGIS